MQIFAAKVVKNLEITKKSRQIILDLAGIQNNHSGL